MSFLSVVIGLLSVLIGFIVGYVLARKNNHYKILHDTINQELTQKTADNNDLLQKLASKQAMLDYLNNDVQQLKTQKTDNDAYINTLRDKLTNLEAQKEFYEQQRNTDLSELEGLKNQINHIIAEKKQLENLKSDTDLRLNTVTHKCEFYEKQRVIDINDNDILKQKIDSLNLAVKTIEARKADIDVKYNSLIKENEYLHKRLEEQNQEFIRLQKTSEQTFENLANKIFNEKSQTFTQKSEKTLNDILTPVKESLGLFQNLVTDKFNHQDKQQYALKEELKRIIDINEKMTFQADSLTKALKGDNKVMGNWGEMLLERILEDSGLTKNIDYVLQASGYDLKGDDGKRQIPDVIVKLPDNKEVIIDAKVSLVDYERLISNPDERATHEKAFLKSVKTHIDGLSAKKYFQNEKLLSPDFVLMFMPIEGAYNLAMQLDNQLHHYAWHKRIAIVSNTTLFATLRTVASLWRIEKQNKNAEEIANRAGLLYEKFAGFIEDMNKIDEKFNQTHKLFDTALGKLYQGRGNLITQVESLKELGAKTSKSLPTVSTKEYLKEIELEA